MSGIKYLDFTLCWFSFKFPFCVDPKHAFSVKNAGKVDGKVDGKMEIYNVSGVKGVKFIVSGKTVISLLHKIL
ncbi:MAG: hypothetical protein Q4C96_08695 [Planctomycetia bacterium]|nr:hypothetical protein [Planctomycetia bacterium]